MILQFGGCSRSKICVLPSNWKSKNVSIKKPWKIYYRFYDPQFKGTNKWGEIITIKGMNQYKTIAERQALTLHLLNNEMDLLDNKGYNPITGKFLAPVEEKRAEIMPQTPVLEALTFALEKAALLPKTKTDVKSCLKYFSISTRMLKKEETEIQNLKRKDVREILDNCEKIPKKVWNENQFNHYRANLGQLYMVLDEFEVVESNPFYALRKKETIEKIRQTPNDDQRVEIDKMLKAEFPTFHRFVNIFFHSGSRRTEMMRLQGKDVDLQGYRFKVTIQKGKKKREVWKGIKRIALPFWQAAMQGCGQDDFVFSDGLKPGPEPIDPAQVTRRWKVHVKKKLGVEADLYSLKHLNTAEIIDTDETSEGEKLAAEVNGHTSTDMVKKVYDVKRIDRKIKRVKALKNTFV